MVNQQALCLYSPTSANYASPKAKLPAPGLSPPAQQQGQPVPPGSVTTAPLLSCHPARTSAFQCYSLIVFKAPDYRKRLTGIYLLAGGVCAYLIITFLNRLLHLHERNFRHSIMQRGISAVNQIVLTSIYFPISTSSGVSSKHRIPALHHPANCSAMLLWRDGICHQRCHTVHGLVSERCLSPSPLAPVIEREKNKTFYPRRISFCFLKGRVCYFITRSTEKPVLLPA